MAAGPLHPKAFARRLGADGDPVTAGNGRIERQRPQEAERIAERYSQNRSAARQSAARSRLRLADAGPCRRSRWRRSKAAARGLHDAEIETHACDRADGKPAGRTMRLPVSSAPSSGNRLMRQAFHELGRLLRSLKRHDEAIEAFRRGLDIAPMMPELSIQLGYVYLRLQRLRRGQGSPLRGRSNISPGSPDALFGMARAHQEIGENAAGRRIFPALPDKQARRCGHLAQSRALSS